MGLIIGKTRVGGRVKIRVRGWRRHTAICSFLENERLRTQLNKLFTSRGERKKQRQTYHREEKNKLAGARSLGKIKHTKTK